MRIKISIFAALAAATSVCAQTYTQTTLTFEDADSKGIVNYAGGSNKWSSLIDSKQYGGTLLYPANFDEEEDELYGWRDANNTELQAELLNNWFDGQFWGGGIAISNYLDADLANGDYEHQLAVPVSNGSTNFAVVYCNSNPTIAAGNPQVFMEFSKGARVIESIDIAPTTYELNVAKNGNSLAKALTNEGDSLTLSIHGYNGSTPTGIVNVDFARDGKFLEDWKTISLHALGRVTKVLFTMDSNDKSSYGINPPAYFAFDNVVVRKYENFVPATFEDIIIADGQTDWYGGTDSGFNNWKSGSVNFATYNDDAWGASYYYDFVVTNNTDKTYTSYTDAIRSAAGGAFEGDNYAVWYNNFYGNKDITLDIPTQISGFAVTNTAWVVNAILNGDGMSNDGGKPFAQGDYIKLVVTCHDAFGNTIGQRNVMLADFSDASDWTYMENWQWVDLSEFGLISRVSFAFQSSKVNDYGVTTPTYFCIDNFGSDAPEATLPLTHIYPQAPTVIAATDNTNRATPAAFYNLNGHRLFAPSKGLNIIKMSDGSARQVLVR